MTNATQTTHSPLLQTGLASLEIARGITIKLLESLDEKNWCKSPCKNANHAAWIAGHLCSTDNYFYTSVGSRDSKIPESWDTLFGMKSESIDDPSKYPSKAELIKALSDTRNELINWLTSLTDDELLKPIEGDVASFASNPAHMMGSLSFHEGMHTGQLSVARRALGFPPMF